MRDDAPVPAILDPYLRLGGVLHHLRNPVYGDSFRRHQHRLAIGIQVDATVLTPEWLAKPVDCVGKLRFLWRMIGVDDFPKRRCFPWRSLRIEVGNVQGA